MHSKSSKIITIAGTRPEIVKLSQLVPILNKKYDHELLYTGQHYSNNMKDIFFDELNMEPDYDLKGNTSDIDILKDNILKVLRVVNPKFVIIYGDTNSTMAGALAAKEINAKLLHLEAGVRDFDLAVPEEVIRLRIDAIAHHLFCPSELCMTVLSYEDIIGKLHLTGNLIVDVCRRLSKIAIDIQQPLDIDLNDCLLLTLHRQENTDNRAKLIMLRNHLKVLKHRIIFPVHPRTRESLDRYNIRLPSNVICIEPVGYLTFLYLLQKCRLVLTDSGGVQEEAIILNKPCITLRHTSARWETILLKANVLFPLDSKDSLNRFIEMMLLRDVSRNPYGENVTKTTLQTIEKILDSS